ncbi:MAG: leucine-rich repeat protein [Clostridia bacterium]|nr:leucine-rich repeat protein [Clostridia bacterium]
MALKQIRCPRCGGELIKNGETYKCSSCNATFVEDYVAQNEKIISEFLTELKQEKVAALRQRLYEQINAKYLSSEEISSIAKKIREYLPEDFLACFYEAACSKNKDDVIKFISQIDYDKQYINLDLVIEFMIRSLTMDNMLSVNNLIENTYKERDIKLYDKYTTELSQEAVKIEKGIYETQKHRDVFIAYSSKDMKIVESLTSFLEAQQISCFVAMRNLRHGAGSVENYDLALQEAIDNCTIFLFISSNNSRSLSCDALKKEIPYVKKDDLSTAPVKYKHNYAKLPAKYKKPRVQYVIEKDNGSIAGEIVAEFFEGYEWCYSDRAVARRILDILMEMDEDEDEEEITSKNEKLEQEKQLEIQRIEKEKEELRKKLEELQNKRININDTKTESESAQTTTNIENNKTIEVQKSKETDSTNAPKTVKINEGQKETKVESKEVNKNIQDKVKPTKPEVSPKVEQQKTNTEIESNKKDDIKVEEKKDNNVSITQTPKQEEKKEVKKAKEAVSFESLKNKNEQLKPGIIVEFGNYPQTANGSSFKNEPIRWNVLAVENDRALLFSEKVIDGKIFDKYSHDYSQSSIRKWLTEDFYKQAFSDEEREYILTTEIKNSIDTANQNNNPKKYNNGINKNIINKTTNDKVFLLSLQDASNKSYGFKVDLYNEDIARQKIPTDYAVKNGVWKSDKDPYIGNTNWFTRSPWFYEPKNIYLFYKDGKQSSVAKIDKVCGIAPAIWVSADFSFKTEQKNVEKLDKKIADKTPIKENKEINKKQKSDETISTKKVVPKGEEKKNDTIVKEVNKPQVKENNTARKIDLTKFSIEQNGTLVYYFGFDPVVYLPDTVKSIAATAFKGSTSIKEIHLSKNTKEISDEAFKNCSSLITVDLNSVKRIGNDAFSNTKIKKLNIPETVVEITSSFNNCNFLEEIVVNPNNKIYSSCNGKNVIFDKITKTIIKGCKNSKLPEDAREIMHESFKGCRDIESITIPKTVVSIGYNAFENCKDLKHVYFDGINGDSQLKQLFSGIFAGCERLLDVVIPDGTEYLANKIFIDCYALKSVYIPESVNHIGDYVFGCKEDETTFGQYKNTIELHCKVKKPLFGIPKGWSKDWCGDKKRVNVSWGWKLSMLEEANANKK